MEIELVDPALRRRAARKATPQALEQPVLRYAMRRVTRVLRWPVAPGVRVRTARAGSVRVRTYTPARVRSEAALLWMHGGGMVVGSPNMDDQLCSQTAAEFGIRVISADYRLAPEHPFPEPLDDCTEVWNTMTRRSFAAGVDPSRIVVGGQSAGGGLAAALAQRVHDSGGPQPLGQWLFCPMLDDRTAADHSFDGAENFVWDNRSNRAGWRALLGVDAGAPSAPAYAVPARREDLRGLPPAWIGVGAIDLFHDEDVRYGERLAQAGVSATVDVVPGAPHAFESLAPEEQVTLDYLSRARAWLGRLIAE